MENIQDFQLPVSIFEMDSQFNIIYANDLYCEFSQTSNDILLGRNWLKEIHLDFQTFALSQIQSSLHDNKIVKCELRFIDKKNEPVWAICQIKALKSKDNTIKYIGSIVDITNIKNKEEHLKVLVGSDPMTKVYTWGIFLEILTAAIARTRKKNKLLSVFFIDIVNFKIVNETLGHERGDKYLTKLAIVIKNCVQPEGIVSRIGGDQFAVLIENNTSIFSSIEMAEKLNEKIAAPLKINDVNMSVNAAIGVCIYPAQKANASIMLESAASAMEQAKKEKQPYQIFNHSIQEKALRYSKIAKYLKNAIKNNEFEIYYQPQINTISRKIHSMEALIRWNNVELNNPMPNEFIPIAEETGLINEIGNWVIQTSLKQFKLWNFNFSNRDEIRMSINLSPGQVINSNLIAQIHEILKNSGIPTFNLLFELTETAIMENPIEKKSNLLKMLHELNIGLSIDDFGTGYSSMSYFRNLPVKELKIDTSLIQKIGKSPHDELIIQAIIAFAKVLKIQVVAEGVETKSQLAFLASIHCDIIQGFYFSKPLNVIEMTNFISKNIDDISNISHYRFNLRQGIKS